MGEEMTSRERIMAALQHKETDRVPLSLGFSLNAPALIQLQKYLKLNNAGEAMYYLMQNYTDLTWYMPEYNFPKERPGIDYYTPNESTDIWGVKRKGIAYDEGGENEGFYLEYSYYPLANADSVDDLNKYMWPSADWTNIANVKNTLIETKKQNKAILLFSISNIFETAWSMTGFEKMLMDLYINPEFAYELLKRVADYYIAHYKKILDEADGMIDLVFTADDLGQQENLLMSLDIWEKIIKPHHVRMNKVLHEYGVKTLYHSCGAIMEAIPGLIDMGVDILEALQFDARGMDPVLMKNKYGEKLCFHGGISVQKTLPFGTVEDVRNEVIERIEVLGKNGGYILAPAHAIQAGTPPENVMAMLETAKNYRRKK